MLLDLEVALFDLVPVQGTGFNEVSDFPVSGRWR